MFVKAVEDQCENEGVEKKDDDQRHPVERLIMMKPYMICILENGMSQVNFCSREGSALSRAGSSRNSRERRTSL
jgi:hypothetical protein